MRNPAAQGNRDANHGEITAAYEALYCKVVDTHSQGGGFPDTVIKIPTKRGPVVALVEIKMPDGTLRPSQIRFISEWGSCVTIVSTREDVFAHVERVRQSVLRGTD